MSSLKEGLISGSALDIRSALFQAEEAERELSYCEYEPCELKRKELGSYYTPVDVALFFWDEYFRHSKISNRDQAYHFVKNTHFIEPACGSGTLVFALILKLHSFGLSRKDLSSITLTCIDINKRALSFLQSRIQELSKNWGVDFENVELLNVKYADYSLKKLEKAVFVFANPPYTSNSKNVSLWKNQFADFMEQSLSQIGQEGSIHFIVPLSIAFSNHYQSLRNLLLEQNKLIVLSNFDNIPDTLFKSGKPNHSNTNKSNSQRCSIISIIPDLKSKILATKLHRWSKVDRKILLSNPPKYFDVTDVLFQGQFIRPENSEILSYIRSQNHLTFSEYISPVGKYSLYVAGVARNFIAFRDSLSSSVHELKFDNKKTMYKALILLSSGLFLDYWRTTGDGFHLTKSNLLDFPITEELETYLEQNYLKAKRIWENREKYQKNKKNSGKVILSYDFSSVFKSPDFYDVL